MKTLPIFVYGTLKRGERNVCIWSDPNPRVQIASLKNASLYDLGPYPCMVAGDEVVCGELWFVGQRFFSTTIEALDRLEGFQKGDEDLYVRRIVQCEVDGDLG